jgi:hypothetical protein
MPAKPPDSPLGAFIAALREAKIDCLLIGSMAAIRQGAPLMTIDYDFGCAFPNRSMSEMIATKRAAGRDKDLAAMPVLDRTLRLRRRLRRAL